MAVIASFAQSFALDSEKAALVAAVWPVVTTKSPLLHAFGF
jgi:hypothetical protein